MLSPAVAVAQEQQWRLPAVIASDIKKAARSDTHPNNVLLVTVTNAIAAYPHSAQLIMARAVAAAPQERGNLVDEALAAFPDLSADILAGGAPWVLPASYGVQPKTRLATVPSRRTEPPFPVPKFTPPASPLPFPAQRFSPPAAPHPFPTPKLSPSRGVEPALAPAPAPTPILGRTPAPAPKVAVRKEAPPRPIYAPKTAQRRPGLNVLAKTPPSGEDAQSGLSFRLSGGYVIGTANEVVYQDTSPNGVLSHLIWDIDKVYMLGLGASYDSKKLPWLTTKIDGWMNAFDGNGDMNDYDWMSTNNAWSHWSTHPDTPVKRAVMFDVNAEIRAFGNKKNNISAIVGFKHEYWKWKARGGNFVYSTAGALRDNYGSFNSDPGITLQQWWSTPYLGIGVKGSLGGFHLSGRVIGSIFTKGEDRDIHHLTNRKYVDDFDRSDMLGANIKATYDFTSRLSLSTMASYQKYYTARGDTTMTTADDNQSFISYRGGNAAGGDLETMMGSISIDYRF